jgi:hypothetical protein
VNAKSKFKIIFTKFVKIITFSLNLPTTQRKNDNKKI